MYFDNYVLEKHTNSLKISADKMVVFQHDDNEPILRGTPKWWDDYVINKIDFYTFDIYFLCSCTVFHGCYNSVTDYKKVWGLNNLEKGFYDNQYQNNKGRVYFGIIKGEGEKSFRSINSSMVLLLPKYISFDADKTYKIISRSKFDFLETNADSYQTLREISELYEGSILLKYNYTNEVSLMIFGDNIKDWFDEVTMTFFEGASESVCRRF